MEDIISSPIFAGLKIEGVKEMESYISIISKISQTFEINDQIAESLVHTINKDILNTKDEAGQIILFKLLKNDQNNNFLKAILKHAGDVVVGNNEDLLSWDLFYNNLEGLKLVVTYTEDAGVDIKDLKLKFAEHIISNRNSDFYSKKIASCLEILNLSNDEVENIYQKVYADEDLELQKFQEKIDQQYENDEYEDSYIPSTTMMSNHEGNVIESFVFDDGFPQDFDDGFDNMVNLGGQLPPSNI